MQMPRRDHYEKQYQEVGQQSGPTSAGVRARWTVFELDLEVDVRVEGNRMIIEPVREPLDLATLLAKVTPENRHEAVDWGPPVGKEVW